MSHINTISEFLLQAGTDYRVFDMARGIRSLASQTFLEIENASVPAPYPRQQHTWFGILFFNKHVSEERYIWFVKLPLDEQGLVITAARKQFLQIVVEALGQTLDKQKNSNNQLPDNPFTFIPNQQQLADFNSIAKVELDIPLSQHLHLVEQYISHPNENDWRTVSMQGIADFTASLPHGGYQNLLISQFLKLAPEMQYALCTSLENHATPNNITRLLIDWYQQNPQDEKRLHSVLRGLAQSQANTDIVSMLALILNSENRQSSATLMLIAARHWQYITEPSILSPYIQQLADCQDDIFVGLFSDLVQIPKIRDAMLGILRWPDKSPQLTRAVGQLFGQNTP
ncbi:MAG: DUF3549 family protein [Paraglaciecola sp.]|uniref:DUF3549 family protein n=1 Tax=Paraglaciecola sp. TaxID=1920173 RepID=UPI003299521D